jgi:transcriptional regulator with XRE-family HTH domain
MRGLTLDEVSQELGCDRALLSRAERGLQRLSPEFKTRIAKAFNMSVDEMFSEGGKDKA